jgi:hypothetical protein
MSSSSLPARTPTRPVEVIAGLLAASAVFLGVLELAYRPFRLAPVALVFLLIATVMTREQHRLVAIGFAVVGVGFVAGAALQVLTHHPLF